MCGIFGVVQFEGPSVAPEILSRMSDVTFHRGPDDEGFYQGGGCAMGMRRLSIIDVAGGHQPLSNLSQTVWLVCNGEIYNFAALRRELEARGHQFKTASDCEVIIHAYVEYGDDFVHRLNGMFAFALWDVTRQRLVIGRDRLGVKPLYIYRDQQCLAFASEAKALLHLPFVDREIDPTALGAYLQLGYVPAPLSMFRGVQKLPPATVVTISGGEVQERRYWQLPVNVDRDTTEAEWVAQVRAQLQRSVEAQMVSDVPIGAFLSGGIDSSAVVAFMARASTQRIKTYSIGFAGGAADEFYNELPHARSTAALFNTDHHEIVVRPDVIGLLPRLLWHMDEPLADMAFVTTYLVAEFARRDVTVILSGVGGDELFGGYRRYLGDHYLTTYRRLPKWVRRGAAAVGERLPADRHSSVLNTLRLAKGFLASADQSFEDRYRGYLEVFSRPAALAMLRDSEAAETFDAIRQAFETATGDDSLNRMLAVDAQTQLPDDLLLLTDKMTMATSLECRVPLLDHELAELAARIPHDIKIRGGRLKHAMKEALAPVLPASVLERRKRGFGLPMGAWLKGDLRGVLDDVLSPEAIAARGWFNPSQVTRLIDAHQASRIDATDPLIALINLELWSRIYLDRRSPEEVAAELVEVRA
jgi:asparagine synthase (glutamine-hydrolysing)